MEKSSKKCCAGSWFMNALLIIGGLNWALVGIGLFIDKNLNVVNLIVGKIMWLEAVIYLLVGIAALSALFGGCCCKKCKGSDCKDCDKETGVCSCSGCGDPNCCCGGSAE
jgi:uncharacterized membrane protein YuzA (DUF378 family)